MFYKYSIVKFIAIYFWETGRHQHKSNNNSEWTTQTLLISMEMAVYIQGRNWKGIQGNSENKLAHAFELMPLLQRPVYPALFSVCGYDYINNVGNYKRLKYRNTQRHNAWKIIGVSGNINAWIRTDIILTDYPDESSSFSSWRVRKPHQQQSV